MLTHIKASFHQFPTHSLSRTTTTLVPTSLCAILWRLQRKAKQGGDMKLPLSHPDRDSEGRFVVNIAVLLPFLVAQQLARRAGPVPPSREEDGVRRSRRPAEKESFGETVV